MGIIILAAIWVLLATGVAFLPMRHQFLPAGLLMVAALGLIGSIFVEFGWVAGLAALIGFVSMFRHPLRYVWRSARAGRWEALE